MKDEIVNIGLNMRLESIYSNGLECIYTVDSNNHLYFLEGGNRLILMHESVK